MNNVVKNENLSLKQSKPLCIVSDFHGVYWAMDFVKSKINHNNQRVVILGDCMDRGNDGIKILSEIKTMEENGKDIMYLPGNHDDMLYLRFKNVIDRYRQLKIDGEIDDCSIEELRSIISNIVRASRYEVYAKNNGQLPTFEEIRNLCGATDGVKTFLDIMLWLENQPLLRIEVDSDGKKIAMGHAAFDMDLYKQAETYTLKSKAQADNMFEILKENAPDSQDFMESKKKITKAYTCLWYRNPNDIGNTNFNGIVKLPSLSEADVIVVGHSPKQMEVEIIGENITRKAVDVDGGTVECYLAGEGKVLKFEPHKEKTPTYVNVDLLKNQKKIENINELKISDVYEGSSIDVHDDVKVYTPNKYEEEFVKIWVPKSKRKLNMDTHSDSNNNPGEDFGDI